MPWSDLLYGGLDDPAMSSLLQRSSGTKPELLCYFRWLIPLAQEQATNSSAAQRELDRFMPDYCAVPVLRMSHLNSMIQSTVLLVERRFVILSEGNILSGIVLKGELVRIQVALPVVFCHSIS